jgi:hypothetical protein
MKNPRVSVIKDNIEKGIQVPNFSNDCSVGQWIDQEMAKKGHTIDHSGLVDLPEFKIDNKTRKKGSKAPHTVGSMTINDIIKTEKWKDTRFYHKTQNQNQVEWDPDFLEITNVKIVDMDIDLIQENLAEGYKDVRAQLEAQVKADIFTKEIKSKNGWVILDGWGHSNSRRMRIPNKAMEKIKNISRIRDSIKQNFDIS